ncbi:retrotransposon protein, putative, ty1-copia subclass [Tanacetum coccineum]
MQKAIKGQRKGNIRRGRTIGKELSCYHAELFEEKMQLALPVPSWKTIKEIRSDHGGKYISQEFKDYLKANGIVQHLTPPYTPQHNRVSERRNRTLLDMASLKRDTPDKLKQRSVKCIFIGYPKETMGYYFYFPPENKIVVVRYTEFFEKCLTSQEISRRVVDLEEIREEEDTTPFEITSDHSSSVSI